MTALRNSLLSCSAVVQTHELPFHLHKAIALGTLDKPEELAHFRGQGSAKNIVEGIRRRFWWQDSGRDTWRSISGLAEASSSGRG